MTLNAGQQKMADAMLEGQLQEHLRGICKQLGLLYYHTHVSKHSPRGFPDTVILGPGGIAFVELKRQANTKRNQPTPAQQQWLDGLTAEGLPTYVWRPEHLLDGTMARVCAALARRPR